MISCEVRQPTRAITPPTERSIPAVRITTVIPTATTTRIVDCLKTLMMFFRVKKFSFRNDKTTHRASRQRGRSQRTDEALQVGALPSSENAGGFGGLTHFSGSPPPRTGVEPKCRR